MDNTEHYRLIRERVNTLVRESGTDGSEPVPACPDWKVRNLLSHLAGVSTDVLAGNLAGAGTEPWTEAQVAPRESQSVAQILDEWNQNWAPFAALFADGGEPPDQLIFDTVTHEHDLRGALDRPGERDNEAIAVGLRFILDGFAFMVEANELPAVRVVSGPHDRVVGSGEPATTLTASTFELLRALTGRRTAAEIASLDWGGADGGTWLSAFSIGPFEPRAASLQE